MIPFINSFLSYLLLLLIIVAIIGVAIFIGITLRKNQNKKMAAQDETVDTEE